jgi:hypothetical protein
MLFLIWSREAMYKDKESAGEGRTSGTAASAGVAGAARRLGASAAVIPPSSAVETNHLLGEIEPFAESFVLAAA